MAEAELGTMVLMPSPCRQGRSRTVRRRCRQQMQLHALRRTLRQSGAPSRLQADALVLPGAVSRKQWDIPCNAQGRTWMCHVDPGKTQTACWGLQHRPGSRPRCPPHQAWGAATCRQGGACLTPGAHAKVWCLSRCTSQQCQRSCAAHCSQAACRYSARILFGSLLSLCWGHAATAALISGRSISVLGSSLTCAPGLRSPSRQQAPKPPVPSSLRPHQMR